jgi:hypothetical protein
MLWVAGRASHCQWGQLMLKRVKSEHSDPHRFFQYRFIRSAFALFFACKNSIVDGLSM